MGAVFSYSYETCYVSRSGNEFQSLMGAVFSYSEARRIGLSQLEVVSIPDGCSVQL